MWDRIRQKETTPTLSRKKLEAWQAAHSSPTSPRGGIIGGNSQYQYAVRGGPTPSKDADDLLANAQLPQDQNSTAYLTPPPGHKSQRDSVYGRPTSSVYSQPSPEAAVFAAHQLRNDVGRPHPLEVSPPSSPDIASPKEGPYPGDVSPIDEAMEIPQPAQERQAKPGTRSNIPQMRRERRKNSDALANSMRESKSRERTTPPRPFGHDVRWDPRTGEPTTGPKGRPSQVNPQEYAHGLTNREGSAPPSPPNPASLRDRLRPVRSANASASPQPGPAPRPEWRGASGRTAIVAPVRDNKNVAPLSVPQRIDKRAGRNVPMLSPIESNGSEAASSPHQASSPVPGLNSPANLGGMPSSEPAQSPEFASNLQSSLVSTAYPTPPMSRDVAQVNRPLGQGSTAASPSPLRSSNDKAIRRKPARVSSGQHPEHLRSDASPKPSIVTPSSEWAQPPSRFSISTHAASTPRASVDEEGHLSHTPTQANTPILTSSPVPEASVLARGRPTIAGYEDSPKPSPTEPVKINLDSPFYTPSSPSTTKAPSKTPGSEGLRPPRGGVIPEGNHSTLSVASVLTLDKSLPRAPPEAEAKDRVTELNAQLEALGNRRININTAIRKLTEMMPTDNILASDAVVRKREAEKRKVETLRQELADVERQSYELGLKLHRAYKRLDRNAEFEPTTLWVRRVTG